LSRFILGELDMIQKNRFKIGKIKMQAGFVSFFTMVIIVTPFCGFLFDCGCNWPWLGLNASCNYYQHVIHKCPWCASKVAGLFSVGLSIIAGEFAATGPLLRTDYRPFQEAVIRTLFGIMVFLAVAMLSAGLSAQWQNYPFSLKLLIL
jgi:hypothetical protein